jgi:hypothetical protein
MCVAKGWLYVCGKWVNVVDVSHANDRIMLTYSMRSTTFQIFSLNYNDKVLPTDLL